MSYYTSEQTNQTWHVHSNAPNANAGFNQTSSNNNQQNANKVPIGPLLSEAANQVANEIKSNIDKNYFKTSTGLINGLEVLTNLIAFILLSTRHAFSIFTMISGFAFWISLMFLIINLFQVPKAITTLPWTKMQFYFSAIMSALYLLAFFVLIFYSFVLGLIIFNCLILFSYQTYLQLKELGSIIQEQYQSSPNLNV